MVILIAGASHTGKTVLAQRLLEKNHYPYLSIDHLKMGLIRSGHTDLTVFDDDKLTEYLWPIVREMIKTVIENGQNLIVEGCYIPFDWAESFDKKYLESIRYCCLVMSENYIAHCFDEICLHSSDVECRLDDSGLSRDWLMEENRRNLSNCLEHHLPYMLIDEEYDVMKQIGGILWPM
jgi:hypothetical protein